MYYLMGYYTLEKIFEEEEEEEESFCLFYFDLTLVLVSGQWRAVVS